MVVVNDVKCFSDINNEMHLLPEPLFSISSDNSYLLHSVGTLNGRIFTAGKDGCLYEITYQVFYEFDIKNKKNLNEANRQLQIECKQTDCKPADLQHYN